MKRSFPGESVDDQISRTEESNQMNQIRSYSPQIDQLVTRKPQSKAAKFAETELDKPNVTRGIEHRIYEMSNQFDPDEESLQLQSNRMDRNDFKSIEMIMSQKLQLIHEHANTHGNQNNSESIEMLSDDQVQGISTKVPECRKVNGYSQEPSDASPRLALHRMRPYNDHDDNAVESRKNIDPNDSRTGKTGNQNFAFSSSYHNLFFRLHGPPTKENNGMTKSPPRSGTREIEAMEMQKLTHLPSGSPSHAFRGNPFINPEGDYERSVALEMGYASDEYFAREEEGERREQEKSAQEAFSVRTGNGPEYLVGRYDGSYRLPRSTQDQYFQYLTPEEQFILNRHYNRGNYSFHSQEHYRHEIYEDDENDEDYRYYEEDDSEEIEFEESGSQESEIEDNGELNHNKIYQYLLSVDEQNHKESEEFINHLNRKADHEGDIQTNQHEMSILESDLPVASSQCLVHPINNLHSQNQFDNNRLFSNYHNISDSGSSLPNDSHGSSCKSHPMETQLMIDSIKFFESSTQEGRKKQMASLVEFYWGFHEVNKLPFPLFDENSIKWILHSFNRFCTDAIMKPLTLEIIDICFFGGETMLNQHEKDLILEKTIMLVENNIPITCLREYFAWIQQILLSGSNNNRIEFNQQVGRSSLQNVQNNRNYNNNNNINHHLSFNQDFVNFMKMVLYNSAKSKEEWDSRMLEQIRFIGHFSSDMIQSNQNPFKENENKIPFTLHYFFKYLDHGHAEKDVEKPESTAGNPEKTQ